MSAENNEGENNTGAEQITIVIRDQVSRFTAFMNFVTGLFGSIIKMNNFYHIF
jgi:hypothetical protein